MKKAILILSVLLLSVSVAFSQSIEFKIREFVRNEYPDDSEMQKYIINNKNQHTTIC